MCLLSGSLYIYSTKLNIIQNQYVKQTGIWITQTLRFRSGRISSTGRFLNRPIRFKNRPVFESLLDLFLSIFYLQFDFRYDILNTQSSVDVLQYPLLYLEVFHHNSNSWFDELVVNLSCTCISFWSQNSPRQPCPPVTCICQKTP